MLQKIVILGAGESGVGAAILAKQKGFEVFVSDSGEIKAVHKETLNSYQIAFEEGAHTEKDILSATEVIKSPGIAETAPIITTIREHKIPIISEIEFAGRYVEGKTICITGSNGKTTTTNLIYHILKKDGKNVAITGNVGNSFALSVAKGGYDYYVIELSSFQLDDMYNFRADISIILNITPDHLNRYNYNFQNYINSKFRILQNQTKENFFIYWADDVIISRELEKRDVEVTLLPFSDSKSDGMAAFIGNNNLITNYMKREELMPTRNLALKGRHNTYNSMAAAVAAQVLNISKKSIRDSLSNFKGVEHRLEHVIKVRGIEFINDSKATNINSTWYALESMTTNVVWIVGGTDKGNDYSELYDIVDKKVRAIVCLGKDNSKIIEAFKGRIDTIVETDNMEEAVRSAYYLAHKDETVLLSPACASFDLFKNYEDRGRQFKEAVRNL